MRVPDLLIVHPGSEEERERDKHDSNDGLQAAQEDNVLGRALAVRRLAGKQAGTGVGAPQPTPLTSGGITTRW